MRPVFPDSLSTSYAMIYTEEALGKLKKKALITVLLSLQSKVESAYNEILDQVR